MGLKERLFETVALPILNRSVLAPYGEAHGIRVNSREKSAELVVSLHGEQEPVRIVVGHYELVRENGDTYAVVRDIETSRAWMTALAARHLVGRALKLPRQIAGVLSRLV